MVTVETNSGAVTVVHIVCWNNLVARELEGANRGLCLDCAVAVNAASDMGSPRFISRVGHASQLAV